MGWGKSTQLGYGLGLTMGAKLAEPKKICVNVMGDAAIGMTGMDIETASRNRIAIMTVVFNNGVMGAERNVLKISDEKYGSMTVGGNYTKVAEALNVPGGLSTGPRGPGPRPAGPRARWPPSRTGARRTRTPAVHTRPRRTAFRQRVPPPPHRPPYDARPARAPSLRSPRRGRNFRPVTGLTASVGG